MYMHVYVYKIGVCLCVGGRRQSIHVEVGDQFVAVIFSFHYTGFRRLNSICQVWRIILHLLMLFMV